MSDNYSTLPSRQTAYPGQSVGIQEAVFAICLGIALLVVSLPFPELLLIYVPQLAMLAVLAGTLSALGPHVLAIRQRVLVALAAALVMGVIGLVIMRFSGFQPWAAEWLLALPYAIGAGLACGTWVARRDSRFSRLYLRAFEAGMSAVVLYALTGLLLVTIRS